MSENIFHIDPIFFLPIDLEENSKSSEDINEDHHNNLILNDYIKNKKKNKIKNIEDEKTNESSSSGKEELDQILSETKTNLEKKENKDIIIYSKSANDPNIKSMTNSSKIYIKEIFKNNWKSRAKRLIIKLKKKLIKQYNNYYKENNDNQNIILNNNNINKYNKKNIKSYNINNNNLYYINHYMNNNINKSIVYNNFNNNILNNIYSNLNINYNQFNHNNNIIINSKYNYNELNQCKRFLNIQNVDY